jgi:hypothetical protein
MHERKRTSEPPTIDRLRADISSGRTGEKVAFLDPAAAPLGTDDEAGGHPPTPEQRRMEEKARPSLKPPPDPSRGPVIFYFAVGGALAVAVIAFAYFT